MNQIRNDHRIGKKNITEETHKEKHRHRHRVEMKMEIKLVNEREQEPACLEVLHTR